MRTIKALGLGLLAMVSAMLILGVGMASASTTTVALCEKAELVCPAGSQYPSGTTLVGKLKTGTKAVLTGSLKVECSESEVKLKTTGEPLGTTLLGEFTGLTFNNCTTCPKVTSLLGLFGPAHLKNSGGLKGLLTVLTPTVHLENCFFFVKCTVSASAVELEVDSTVQPPVVRAVNEKLQVSGPESCGTQGTWNAEYVLTSPSKALYIES